MYPEISIKDYTYILPEEKIAKYPLPNRDDSKILIFEDNKVRDSKFSNLDELLPDDSLMIINNTKVVPARLFFKKESGAHLEIFCLEPYLPFEYNVSFATTESCSWICIIGNSKRWKEGYVYFDSNGHDSLNGYCLKAKVVNKIEDKSIVEFSWKGGIPFSELMEKCGKVPIPPYLNREAEDSDTERYQTLYAQNRGSVAAPTAGLHFSENVLNRIKKKGIDINSICLHVGAGTFLPVKSDFIINHHMHYEPFSVSKDLIVKLINKGSRKVISVGTTSTRCLESLYYLGIHCIEGGDPSHVSQWEPYDREHEYPTLEALTALLTWMESNGRDRIDTKTGIIIVPTFNFRIVDILITNFHQPNSTLLLLIAAFVGDFWKEIYKYALNNDFRFLSYGDSSILFRSSAL
ncbi:MAG: S-adenosylmethionine:tRNA ribosyltransferase-isomerase [Rikenellaceae bacterium]|nr:S-adenosylmethionine:tRNA ribosyltransferase-isomerase [Rikenellaceae bacterium]